MLGFNYEFMVVKVFFDKGVEGYIYVYCYF